MMKKIKITILVILLLFFGFCLARDFLIKLFISTVATNVTGAPTHIGSLSLSVIRQSVKISNFRMYNPKGFPKEILVDIPKMEAVCDLGAILKGKIHLKRIDFELKEITLVKNKEGKLNVDSLKITEEKKPVTTEKKPERPKKQMMIQIDLMNLAIGRIVSKDYSIEGPAAIKVYDINLNKSYKNITSVQELALIIISEPLKAAGIQGLKVYAVSMLTGVAALPVAVAFTFTGKDHAQASFNVGTDKVYSVGLQVLKQIGTIKKENKDDGIINAEVNGTSVTFKLKKINDATTEITVSARKLGIPKPEIASGIIYQITDRLKK